MEFPAKPALLIVDTDVGFVRAAAELARAAAYDITVASTLHQAEHWLDREHFALVLIDPALPDGSGLDLLALCARRETDVVLVTGQPTIESAVLACRRSLLDYLVKPIDPAHYRDLLERIAQRRRLPLPIAAGGWHGLVGNSAAFSRLVTQIQRVAPTGASVLIHGENGVGKAAVARAIHAESGCAGAFVGLSCAASDSASLSAQLFGDPATGEPGALQRARDGTLFLDEITGLDANQQARLQHELDTARGMAVARVIAASVHPGARSIADRRLREDLYYRLGEFPIDILPLRERPDDVAALASVFLARLNEQHGTCKSFTGTAVDQLRQFSWPGNVRELRNVVGRAYLMASSDVIADPLDDLRVTEPLRETPSTLTLSVGTTLGEIERRMVMKTLEFFDNDKSKAARALGISVKTIYNKLAKFYGSARTS